MNTNNQISAGRGFRVNNPPSASFAPGAGEVCDRGASAEKGTTHGQINDRRSFSTKLRNYNRTIWTIAEKTVIYNCFVYSRHECWGRKKNEVFEKQIKLSDLPKCKVEETTVKKLYSITSQINKYLTPEVMTEMEVQGKLRAENDYSVLSDEDKLVFDESFWTSREK